MRVRTAEALQTLWDHEFAWRLKEILDVKATARTVPRPRQDTLIRSGVPLLYAHWEGFVKASAQGLVNYVAHQPLRHDELSPCFITRALRGHLAKLSDAKRFEVQVAAIEFIRSEMSGPSTLSPKSSVDTGSNLNFDYLRDICVSIGLDPAPYEAKEQFIDRELLARRNSIAHGDYLLIDGPGFGGLCDGVLALLRTFKTDLENSLALEAFKA